MTDQMFVVVFVAGAICLAVWIHARFSRFAPKDVRGVLLHVAGSLVACQLIAPAATSVLVGTGSRVLQTLSLMVVALPALVYTLLCTIWLISHVQSGLRNGMLR